jgi:hypothetical protein
MDAFEYNQSSRIVVAAGMCEVCSHSKRSARSTLPVSR